MSEENQEITENDHSINEDGYVENHWLTNDAVVHVALEGFYVDNGLPSHPATLIERSNEDEEDTTTTGATSEEPVEELPSLDVSRHSYLGAAHDVTSLNSHYCEEGSIEELPVVPLPDVVLFPGETIPIRIMQPFEIQMLQQLVNSETHSIAVFHVRNFVSLEKNLVGTISKVFKMCDDHRGSSMLAQGRQRCKLLHWRLSERGLLLGRVQVLKDLHGISSPLQLGKTCHYRETTFWPRRIYELYEAETLVAKAQRILKKSDMWSSLGKRENVKTTSSTITTTTILQEKQDPTFFSYWLAANLPLNDQDRQALLNIDSTVRRLRYSLEKLCNSTETLNCMRCGNVISKKSQMFCMQSTGVIGTFVNSGGFIHQMITLKNVEEEYVRVQGEPCTQDSWYPGYAWTILYCRNPMCHAHLGWRFDAFTENLPLQYFYGVRRSECDTMLSPW